MKIGTNKSLLDFFGGRGSSMVGILAVVVTAAMVAIDWMTWVELDISSVYSLPLVLAAVARRRGLLWALTLCLVFATFAVYGAQIPSGTFSRYEPFFINRALSAVTVVVTAGLLHVWMLALNAVAAQSQSLADQNRELDRLRKFADRANSRKTELLAAVSHDIGTPLSVINMVSDIILQAAESPHFEGKKIPEMVRRLQRNTHSLMALRSALIDIAALDSGKTPLSNSKFSLNDLLDEEGQRLLPLAQAKNLRLAVDAPNPPVRLLTDRLKLSRVLTNLVTNACKYTEQGTVSLTAVLAPNGAVLIRVTDTGIGMAPDDLQRIFDEYGQLGNPERDSKNGWGLGLAICRRLIAAIGGHLTVESEKNRGTVFTVHLPQSCMVHAVRTPLATGHAVIALQPLR